ncbi:hypothetical protein MXB_3697, partial [Myxobolus squamalis]
TVDGTFTQTCAKSTQYLKYLIKSMLFYYPRVISTKPEPIHICLATKTYCSTQILSKRSGYSVSVTAYPSGVSVGSTVWLIEVDGGENRIVYAPEINHQNDRHLNSITVSHFLKPTLLITGSYTMNRSFTKKSNIEARVIDSIKSTITKGGNTMIVTDTAGRVLELLLFLSELYNSEELLKNIASIFVNHVATHVIELAKFQLEWMNENLLKMFQSDSKNPFIFDFLKISHNVDDLNEIHKPTIIIISDVCVENGKGFEFLIRFCKNPFNKIIFTKGCYHLSNISRLKNDINVSELVVSFRNLDLTKTDISFNKKLNNTIVEETVDFSDDEAQESQILPNLLFRITKPTLMYPNIKNLTQWDLYGEIIKPEDFITLVIDSNENQISYKKKELKDAVDQAKFDPDLIPHYFGQKKLIIDKQATIENIPLDGLADCESLLTVIKMINPFNLIIVHGSDECTQKLLEAAKKLAIPNLYSPDPLTMVEIIDERISVKVRLKNQLISSLNFMESGNSHQVAWIDFCVDNSSSENKVSDSYQYTLGVVQDQNKIHKSIFLNELRFSELCQSLTKKGYSVNFRKGVLNCNDGKVTIQRNTQGEISMNGEISNEYFHIRKILYKQLCMI